MLMDAAAVGPEVTLTGCLHSSCPSHETAPAQDNLDFVCAEGQMLASKKTSLPTNGQKGGE
jgi:hypothetical protein